MWTHRKTLPTTSLKTWLPLAVGLALAASLVLDVTAGKDGPPDPVAEIDGRPVAWGELEQRVAGQLQQLEIQRHRLLETALDALVEERLLDAESARRGVSREELLGSEVSSKIRPVTDAEVDAWYAENQARVRRPKEEVAEQIRELLKRQREQTRRAELLASLRKRFEVVSHLEPFRLDLDPDGAPVQGPAGAPVTLVEFSDFQCPYCARINPTVSALRERYGDKLRVVFRQFPLRQLHPHAQKAAEAALCAGDQSEFWPMHDAIFASQQQMSVADMKAHADRLDLDTARFAACLDGEEKAEAVQKDLDAGRRAGVSGTPALFINGRPVQLVNGRPFVDQLAEVVDDELRRLGG
jgi:protein-disulfide isomerase